MKALDSRQKKLLAGILVAVLLIVGLLLLPLFAPKEEAVSPSVVGVIPEADLTEGDGSKTASYRNGSISDYWDDLGEDSSAETTWPPERSVT